MPFPEIPDTITPAARDAIYTSLGLIPGLALSATIGSQSVTVSFVALDEDDNLIRDSNGEFVYNDTILVEE